MSATTSRAPARPPTATILRATLGALLGLGLVGLLAGAVGKPLLMAPFGATAVLAFALPDSPLAQPRSIVGGHVVAAAVGFAVLVLVGAGTASLALGGAAALGAMLVTRTLHAPAGATPLVVLAEQPDATFMLTPVLLGSLGIVAVALVVNNVPSTRRYPAYWW